MPWLAYPYECHVVVSVTKAQPKDLLAHRRHQEVETRDMERDVLVNPLDPLLPRDPFHLDPELLGDFGRGRHGPKLVDEPLHLVKRRLEFECHCLEHLHSPLAVGFDGRVVSTDIVVNVVQDAIDGGQVSRDILDLFRPFL